MKTARVATLMALSMVLAASPVLAGTWMARLNGGASLPMGDFADKDIGDAQTGYQFGGGVGYAIDDRFGVGIEADYGSNKHGAEGTTEDVGGGVTVTAKKDKFITFHVGVNGTVMMPTSGPVKPYGLIGLGLYNVKEDYEYVASTGEVFTDENENADQPGSKFGGKIGAGATYMLNDRVGLGGEGAFNYVTMDKDKFETSSLQYVELRALVTFKLMAK